MIDRGRGVGQAICMPISCGVSYFWGGGFSGEANPNRPAGLATRDDNCPKIFPSACALAAVVMFSL